MISPIVYCNERCFFVRIVIHTDKSLEECVELLNATMDTRRMGIGGIAAQRKATRPVLGTINGNELCLEKRRSYRNSMAPVLYATLSVNNSGGTTLEGKFGIDKSAKVAFTFIPIVIGLAVYRAYTNDHTFVGLLNDPISMAILIGVPLAFVVGNILAVGEKYYLAGYLKGLLQTGEK